MLDQEVYPRDRIGMGIAEAPVLKGLLTSLAEIDGACVGFGQLRRQLLEEHIRLLILGHKADQGAARGVAMDGRVLVPKVQQVPELKAGVADREVQLLSVGDPDSIVPTLALCRSGSVLVAVKAHPGLIGRMPPEIPPRERSFVESGLDQGERVGGVRMPHANPLVRELPVLPRGLEVAHLSSFALAHNDEPGQLFTPGSASLET